MLDRRGSELRRRVEADRRAALSDCLRDVPENVGPRWATARGGIVHSVRSPGSQDFRSRYVYTAVMLAPSPGITAAFNGDKPQSYDAPRGMIVVSPSDVPSHARWSATRENAVISIDPEYLEELAVQEFDLGAFELQPPSFGTIDMEALHTAELIRAELARGGMANELHVDSLVTICGIHLLRNYTSARIRSQRPKGGLSDLASCRVQEYMDEHFARRLSVSELATICGLSPAHFIQSFTRSFGQPPHRYLVLRRLAFAEKLLFETEMTIAEIAYLGGFSSQSHLTSAMRKYKNMTPAQVRARR